MRSHSAQEMIAGYRGSMVLIPAAYTNADIPPFKSFRPSKSGAKITVLKGISDTADDTAAGVDMLAHASRGHIKGGATTALEPPDLVICRFDVFTDITVTVENITIYF